MVTVRKKYEFSMDEKIILKYRNIASVNPGALFY